MITLKKFKNIKKNLPYLMAFFVLFTAFFTIMPETAVAVDLAGAKSAGFVGEKPDGYLGIVKNAPPDVHKLVQNINSKRRAKYLSIAKKNNQELRVVESLVGKKLINGTKPGNYYMNQDGKWAKK